MINDSTTKTEILLVRHVPTALNEKQVSRSWLKTPPDPEKLKEMGPGIADILKEHNVHGLVSSDLPRAARTAKFVADKMGIEEPETSFNLRTWDTGMAGKKESETLAKRKSLIKYPQEKPPGGEAFQDVIDRNTPELKDIAKYNADNPDAPKAVVVHGHHHVFVESIFGGKDPDPNDLDTLDSDFPPGSVSKLTVDDKGATLQRIHPKGEDSEKEKLEK